MWVKGVGSCFGSRLYGFGSMVHGLGFGVETGDGGSFRGWGHGIARRRILLPSVESQPPTPDPQTSNPMGASHARTLNPNPHNVNRKGRESLLN